MVGNRQAGDQDERDKHGNEANRNRRPKLNARDRTHGGSSQTGRNENGLHRHC